MRWNVETVDRSSGQTNWVTIEARDAIGAREDAGHLGVVGRVLPAQSLAPPVGPGASSIDYREVKRAIRWGVVEGGLLLTLVLILISIGLSIVAGVLSALLTGY